MGFRGVTQKKWRNENKLQRIYKEGFFVYITYTYTSYTSYTYTYTYTYIRIHTFYLKNIFILIKLYILFLKVLIFLNFSLNWINLTEFNWMLLQIITRIFLHFISKKHKNYLWFWKR